MRYIFYRFVKWIKEKSLPKELEGYCKTVLNYLSQNSSDFMTKEEQTDEEDSSDEDLLETDTEEEENQEGQEENNDM